MIRKLIASAAIAAALSVPAVSIASTSALASDGQHKSQTFTWNGVVPSGGFTYSSTLVATAS